MYKVLIGFADLQDKEHVYKTGDTFPRLGLNVSDERLKELSTARNRLGKPLIEKVEEPVEKAVIEPEASESIPVKRTRKRKPKEE